MKRGFTLLELLVATALMLIAISIALVSTIGSNNVIQRTEVRSALLEASREAANTFRLATLQAKMTDVNIISAVSYPSYPTDDLNPTFTKEPTTSITPGFATEIRQLGRIQRQNICYVVGRVELKNAASGEPLFFFSATGSNAGVVIYQLNDNGNCQYSTILYRGRLTSERLKLKAFELMLRKTDYACEAGSCAVGQLRYHLSIETSILLGRGGQGSRRPSLDIVSSLPVGLD